MDFHTEQLPIRANFKTSNLKQDEFFVYKNTSLNSTVKT